MTAAGMNSAAAASATRSARRRPFSRTARRIASAGALFSAAQHLRPADQHQCLAQRQGKGGRTSAASTPAAEHAAGELCGQQAADRGERHRHEEHRGTPPAAGGRLQQQVAEDDDDERRTAGSTAGSAARDTASPTTSARYS